MTTTIRPVTSKWPSAATLWEATSLPLAVVVKPLSSSASTATVKHNVADIPKCLYCGAPHSNPDHASMNYLLCHYCGKTSSCLYREQAEGRPSENLDQPSFSYRGAPSESTFALPLYENVYQLPAVACPPVWWIVVDGTPTVSRSFWLTVGTCLQKVAKSMPAHTHVGLLVATSQHLGVWDLSSAVPHVKHYPWKTAFLNKLPLSHSSTNLQAALRALGDTPASTFSRAEKMPLGDTLQVILNTMQSATHPGNAVAGEPPTYAGGKVTVLLHSPPVEVQSRKSASGNRGTGGHGGYCSEIGQRFATPTATVNTEYDIDPESARLKQSDFNMNETDMTASNLSKRYSNNTPEVFYSELGMQCAEAALGVDVLIMDSPENASQDFGVPFLRQLSDRSGAPGPLFLSSSHQLEKELASRVPWNNCFGGLLRMRTSPGFSIDTSPVEGSGDDGPQLAPLYSNGGFMGPGSSLPEEGLFMFGSCDSTTAVTVDLVVSLHVENTVYVDGMGDSIFQHGIQTCFAYTTVEQLDNGSYVTVRRLTIKSVHLPLVHDMESLYTSLDPEALAVVLFHKLTIASLQDGLVQTHEIAQEWLESLLISAYRSAVQEEVMRKNEEKHGLTRANPSFFAQERLLHCKGDLSTQDVLLCQGHERLRHVPLVVFALLQCDALLSMGSSMDARSAASAQMYSMPPNILARCIVPRLELWASGEDVKEAIEEHLDLNLPRVAENVVECRLGGSDGLLLFLDCPREIVVCDSRQVVLDGSSTAPPVVICKALEQSIAQACKSYRVPPPIVYELSPSSDGVLPRMVDALVEDSQTIQGLSNFTQWKNEIAAMVQEEVEE